MSLVCLCLASLGPLALCVLYAVAPPLVRLAAGVLQCSDLQHKMAPSHASETNWQGLASVSFGPSGRLGGAGDQGKTGAGSGGRLGYGARMDGERLERQRAVGSCQTGRDFIRQV